MKYENFTWLVEDICSTLILRVTQKDRNNRDVFYGIFDIFNILGPTGEKLVINNANIDDLTKFLMMGIVRFTNLKDVDDVIDVPLRNLYKLYESSNKIIFETGNYQEENNKIKVADLEGFAVIDGTSRTEGFDIIACSVSGTLSDELKELLFLSKNFGAFSMQEKIEALEKLNKIIYIKNKYGF